MQVDFSYYLYTILLGFYIKVIVPRWEAQIMLDFYKGCRSTWYLCPTWYICKDKDPFQRGILLLTNYNLRHSNHKNHTIRERLVSKEILHIIYFQPTCCGEGWPSRWWTERRRQSTRKWWNLSTVLLPQLADGWSSSAIQGRTASKGNTSRTVVQL